MRVLFQTDAAAAGKVRSPMVAHTVRGATSADVVEERSRRRALMPTQWRLCYYGHSNRFCYLYKWLTVAWLYVAWLSATTPVHPATFILSSIDGRLVQRSISSSVRVLHITLSFQTAQKNRILKQS